jgi:hypothetical protein
MIASLQFQAKHTLSFIIGEDTYVRTYKCIFKQTGTKCIALNITITEKINNTY